MVSLVWGEISVVELVSPIDGVVVDKVVLLSELEVEVVGTDGNELSCFCCCGGCGVGCTLGSGWQPLAYQ